jgi:hypothetical protein
MPVDFLATATAVSFALQPFLPWLTSLGQSAGEKLKDVVVEAGGDAAKSLAKTIWDRIKARFAGDSEVDSATSALAISPNSDTMRRLFVEVLTKRLEANPDFEQELVTLLGGQKAVQKIVAGNEAWFENVRQIMAGQGEQEMRAGDKAVFKGIVQSQGGAPEPKD